MTNYNAKLMPLSSNFSKAQIKTGVLSGVVTSGGTPKARRVALFREGEPTVLMETRSNAATGAFSFSVPFSTDATKYSVIAYGEYGESDKVLSNLTAFSS